METYRAKHVTVSSKTIYYKSSCSQEDLTSAVQETTYKQHPTPLFFSLFLTSFFFVSLLLLLPPSCSLFSFPQPPFARRLTALLRKDGECQTTSNNFPAIRPAIGTKEPIKPKTPLARQFSPNYTLLFLYAISDWLGSNKYPLVNSKPLSTARTANSRCFLLLQASNYWGSFEDNHLDQKEKEDGEGGGGVFGGRGVFGQILGWRHSVRVFPLGKINLTNRIQRWQKCKDQFHLNAEIENSAPLHVCVCVRERVVCLQSNFWNLMKSPK